MEMKKRINLELRNRAPEKVRGGGAAGRAPPCPRTGDRRPPQAERALPGPASAAESGSAVAQEPRGARAALPGAGPGAVGGGRWGPAPPPSLPPSSPRRQLGAAGSPLDGPPLLFPPPPKLAEGARAGPQLAPAVNPLPVRRRPPPTWERGRSKQVMVGPSTTSALPSASFFIF